LAIPLLQGCQIFLAATYQNGKNLTYIMTTKYTQWPDANIQNGQELYQKVIGIPKH
jgi:hypothetical protein